MNHCSRSEPAGELRVPAELRTFARLLLPIFEVEYQTQLTSPQPCWMYLAIVERRMRQLEKQAQ